MFSIAITLSFQTKKSRYNRHKTHQKNRLSGGKTSFDFFLSPARRSPDWSLQNHVQTFSCPSLPHRCRISLSTTSCTIPDNHARPSFPLVMKSAAYGISPSPSQAFPDAVKNHGSLDTIKAGSASHQRVCASIPSIIRRLCIIWLKYWVMATAA